MHLPAGDLDVLAIGETLVDLISEKEVDTLRDADTFRKYLGGAPANIAANVAKLGGRSAVISKIGTDTLGQFLLAELRRHGVSTDYLIVDHRVGTSFILIARSSGTPDFEPYRNGDYMLEPCEVDEGAIVRSRVVHASAFALSREPGRSAVREALRLGKKHGKIISLDPNYSPRIWPDRSEALEVLNEMLSYATLTKPSLDDAQRLFGRGCEPEVYIGRFHDMGASVVVFTMGSKGILVSQDGRVSHIPGRPVRVEDATGAGDAFWAGFLMALLDGRPLEQCALFAREIVEIKLATVGPLPADIDPAEIRARLEAS